jgi:hypothetical protein
MAISLLTGEELRVEIVVQNLLRKHYKFNSSNSLIHNSLGLSNYYPQWRLSRVDGLLQMELSMILKTLLLLLLFVTAWTAMQ